MSHLQFPDLSNNNDSDLVKSEILSLGEEYIERHLFLDTICHLGYGCFDYSHPSIPDVRVLTIGDSNLCILGQQ